MPYSLSLPSCTILLNQSTKLIIDLFTQTCAKAYADKQDKLSLDLQISEPQLRKGFLAKILQSWENFNEKKYGGSYVSMQSIENIKLDPKAHKMLYEFTNEINTVYAKYNLNSFDLNNQESIDSPALVLRIILLRLVTLALSDDNTYARDGEILLKIYTDFVDQVLCYLDELGPERKIIRYFSKSEHLDWISDIRQVVLSVKLIHSHQDNLTECLTTLKSISFSLQRMLLAHLYLANNQCSWPLLSKFTPKVNPTDLDDQFVADKLYEFEQYLAAKNPYKNPKDLNEMTRITDITNFAAIEHLGHKQKAKAILDNKNICETPTLAALIACQNNNCSPAIYQRLVNYYSLYFKLRCIQISLEQIDELLTTCSWVPLVMGALNLSQLCDLIRIHLKGCSKALSIPENDIINNLHFANVLMQKCFNARKLLDDLPNRINALEELQNPIKIEKIKYQISFNLNNLLEVQRVLQISLLQNPSNLPTKNWGENFYVVDEKRQLEYYRDSEVLLLDDKPSKEKHDTEIKPRTDTRRFFVSKSATSNQQQKNDSVRESCCLSLRGCN